MKTQNLISKLTKMNIEFSIVDCNGYNKDIEFKINGMFFKAGFTSDSDKIQDFCRDICFDNTNQETTRRFFDNFTHLLRYAKY